MKSMYTYTTALILALCIGLSPLATAADDGEWVSIFNGKDLSGWTPKIRYHELGDNFGNTFRVKDGAITVAYDGYKEFNETFGHIFYANPYSHYKFRMEYRFTGEQAPGGPGWAYRNSGIMLHSPHPAAMERDQDFPVSVEIQLLGGDGEKDRTTANMCSPGTHIESDGKVIERHCVNSESKTFHGDQWVTVEVEVRGNDTIKHFINGELVMQYDHPQLDPKDEAGGKVVAERNGDRMLTSGYISLQSESHPVEFRNIEILALPEDPSRKEIRIGIIGLDTSHVTAFTKILNDPESPNFIPGAKVVAAFKGGSPDIESSHTRVEGFTKTLQDTYGVEIVDTIEELCTKVDASPHLEQVKPVFEAGLPVFIDKPVGGTLADALEIQRLGKKHDVLWFSSSSYRFYDGMKAVQSQDVGEMRGAMSYGPCHLEEHHPDFFWYGVHPVEGLYTIMGPGCESVVRTTTENTDVATGVWSDGRVGTFRGLRNASTPHQVTIFGTKKVAQQSSGGDYANLVKEIVRFFQSGCVPVYPSETIEMFAFMEAADESKRQGGTPVKLSDVIKKAGGSAK
jgi:hypothetical protein